jgi:phage FluMu gp28-like protein
MRIELPNPHINQQVILDSSKRFRVVMCGRRFGKSELSQIEIIVNALQGKQVAYITPTYQLARVFFDRLTKAIPFENNKSELSIKFPNDGAVYFFTGERLDNLRGRKFHFIVIDEASFIPNLEEGWQNSIRPTLTDYKGRALFLSTPKGKNFFYSLFLKSGEPDWESFKFTTYDNPYIDRGEIDDARTQLPQVVFEQEYMANPAENASNPFGSSYIKQCTFELSHEPPIAFGVDLAKSVDWSVIIGLDKNGSVCHFERFQKDWRQTKLVIQNLPKVPVLVDSTGVGDPIFEDLQREGVLVTGFKFTQTSKQQLMEGLASAIQQRKITFPEGYITNELEVFEYQYTATGVRYSAPQGFHDDCVMALGLAWQHYTRNQAQGKYSFA